MAITLYVKTGCPYCVDMRKQLDANAVDYTELNVSERPELVAELLKLTGGRREVPVLVDGTRVEVAPSGG